MIRQIPLLFAAWMAQAGTPVTMERLANDQTSPDFAFKSVVRPARNDAAAEAKFEVVDGRPDLNSGDLAVLLDGKAPQDEDSPRQNFFFRQGTDGGRLMLDLGRVVEIRQVNTYSWHTGSRAPQVYALYGAAGTESALQLKPARPAKLEETGWTLIARVDSRPDAKAPEGGQHGVNIGASTGSLGKYRYLVFDISQTESNDPFGNTFFSEVDVVDAQAKAPEPMEKWSLQPARHIVEIPDGGYKVVLDTSETPDLTPWVTNEIAALVREWYPKLVRMLPSEGFEAPKQWTMVFYKDMRGVADTSGTRIRCAGRWMRANIKGESKGAIFHEMVHVVQQYGSRPRGGQRVPTWLTEGITDYIRFFLFEPQTRGAEISPERATKVRYDNSYRVTGNFINWVTRQHNPDFVQKLNAIIREGKYNESVWKDLTGHTMEELGETWKKSLEKPAITPASASAERSR